MMELKLKKAELVNLSHDKKVLPSELTPQVASGVITRACGELTANAYTCPSDRTGSTHRCCQIP